MSNKKFKSLEEAQKAYDDLVADQPKVIEKAVADAVKVKDDEIAALTKRAVDAEEVAKDAVEKIDNPKGVTVTVDKVKYRIIFGVDGKSKEELAADKELLEKLIKKGSAALEKVK